MCLGIARTCFPIGFHFLAIENRTHRTGYAPPTSKLRKKPDVIEHPDWYGARYPEAIRQVRAAATAGDPNRLVTIYRAVPIGVTRINTGDWVALSRSYANDESQRVAGDGSAAGNIITAQVPASSLYSEGILEEWGYQGPPIETLNQREHTKAELRDKIARSADARQSAPAQPDMNLHKDRKRSIRNN